MPHFTSLSVISDERATVKRLTASHDMWTEITPAKYERKGKRYASDVTDGEWVLIEP